LGRCVFPLIHAIFRNLVYLKWHRGRNREGE